MVRVIRTPGFSRKLFSGNELSGYEDGVKYTPLEAREGPVKKRQRKKKVRSITPASRCMVPPVVTVQGIVEL